MSRFRAVCQIDDVPTGESRLFVIDERMVGVFHLGDEFFAIDNTCPHAGASLAHGTIEGEVVRCRIHHWRFRVRDGVYLDEARPDCNLQVFPVRIVGREVQVEI